MKNKRSFLLVLFFILISCSGEKVDFLKYSHVLGDEKMHKLRLNISKTDSVVAYTYDDMIDSSKNIAVNYHLKEDYIFTAVDTFYSINNVYNSKMMTYKMYQTKKENKEPYTFVFHKDYGLFASLGVGMDRIFLKDSVTPIVKEFIFKDVYINLNSK